MLSTEKIVCHWVKVWRVEFYLKTNYPDKCYSALVPATACYPVPCCSYGTLDAKCHCHCDTNLDVVPEDKRAVSFATILIWNYYCDHFVLSPQSLAVTLTTRTKLQGEGQVTWGIIRLCTAGNPETFSENYDSDHWYERSKANKMKLFVTRNQTVKI
jgi:hypothetical protein